MAMLGAGLRAELADALGLGALRKEFRADLRALARELKALRIVVQRAVARDGRGFSNASSGVDSAVSAERIRSARELLGDSRKAFAQRLSVSPGIVFAWESGRSTPRRKAIVARLRRVLATRPAASKSRARRGSPSKSEPGSKRVLKLSGKRRAALKVQGQYMGYLRSLEPSQRAEVKKVKAASGYPAAIKLARKLRRA